MKRRRRTCANVFLLVTGIILILVGVLIFAYFGAIYDYLINSAMKFTPDSEPYRAWLKNDPPLRMEIYLFNWTNPEDIRVKGVKPKFEEVGPYVFSEIKEKINITWNENNGTISYRSKKTYFFDEENSPRSLDDVVTILNPVPLAIAYKARNFGYFSKKTISMSLSTFSSIHATKTVGEILFDGYEETILSVLSSVPMAGVQDRFGMFYGKNGTLGDDGTFSMYTTNDENFGKVATWNYQNHSGYYDDHCGDVKGSAGEFYPINRKRDFIQLFSSELCRTATLEYDNDVVIKDVKGYKYTARNLFDNGTTNPANSCFCQGECHPAGILNVSICRKDSPTFLSFPHFYGADPYYVNAVEGLHPQDEHEFFISLEPKSAIVIDIAAMMQVNMLLQPIQYITMYENVPRVFMPIFYFTQRITLKDDLAQILIVIQNLPQIANIAVLILVTLGLMSLMWMVLNIFCCIRNNSQEYKISRVFNREEIPLKSMLPQPK